MVTLRRDGYVQRALGSNLALKASKSQPTGQVTGRGMLGNVAGFRDQPQVVTQPIDKTHACADERAEPRVIWGTES